jgi:hypothetical protein
VALIGLARRLRLFAVRAAHPEAGGLAGRRIAKMRGRLTTLAVSGAFSGHLNHVDAEQAVLGLSLPSSQPASSSPGRTPLVPEPYK